MAEQCEPCPACDGKLGSHLEGCPFLSIRETVLMSEASASPDNTGQKQTKFQAGQSGNPSGRPKGARSKLGEAFLKELLADWEAHGAKAISDMREEKPGDYVKVVASILPKEVVGEDGGPLQVVINKPGG